MSSSRLYCTKCSFNLSLLSFSYHYYFFFSNGGEGKWNSHGFYIVHMRRPKWEKKKTEKDKNQSATCGYESYRDCLLNSSLKFALCIIQRDAIYILRPNFRIPIKTSGYLRAKSAFFLLTKHFCRALRAKCRKVVDKNVF